MKPGLHGSAACVILLGVACGPGPDISGWIDDGDDVDAGDDDGGDDGGVEIDAGIDAPLIPDAEPADAVIPTVPPDVDGRLVINEVMPKNVLTVQDDTGVYSDWFEIYNPTDQTLSLHGYTVTDDLAVPAKYRLPEGVTIPAGGRLVLWADHEPTRGLHHIGFHLKREEGAVGLARPDGTWIDRVAYGVQSTDLSAARTPDGSDKWKVTWHPSPGAANEGGTGQPMGLEDPIQPPEAIPAAGDLTQRILGYDVIFVLGLEVSAESAASLEANPRTYVPATLVYDGRRYGPVGIRLKGGGSFQPFSAKPSFRINVDEYVQGAEFFGLEDLTLNNMNNDYSMMHERLSYMVAREVGIPASRANHAWLTVNDTIYGLYTNVETVRRRMIRRWFTNDQGSLFEATDVDFKSQYISHYELEFGPNDRSLLTSAANALTISDPDAAIAAADDYVDLAEFTRFWAMESVVAQLDAFPFSNPGDDYFVYADPATQHLFFLPWGMDETFYSGSYDVTNVISVLATKCKASPACFQSYADKVWDIQDAVEDIDLDAERARVANQIAPLVAMDTKKPYSNDVVTTYQASIHYFLANRRSNLAGMVPPRSH